MKTKLLRSRSWLLTGSLLAGVGSALLCQQGAYAHSNDLTLSSAHVDSRAPANSSISAIHEGQVGPAMLRFATQQSSDAMDPILRTTPLDPERRGPPASLTGKKNEKGTVEIYERTSPPDADHVIVLRLPESFRYGSSRGISKGWGINILTYYPSFSSPLDPENSQFDLSCAGYCNGRILISLENHYFAVSKNTTSWADVMVEMAIDDYYNNQPSNVEIKNRKQQFGFDHVFERIIHPYVRSKSGIIGQSVQLDDIFMYHTLPDGKHHDLYARCSMWTPIHACTLHFSNTCNPALAIEVSIIPFEKMDTAFDVRTKVDHFISSMIKNSKCS